ncbi:hypothetical protein FISHEDRAFT_57555 [Fistulina hepatica ATCC 64428]|uniref:Glucose receptor Git3 N-terminal domain-containing protein n=1 Tax=Fistulina hepatica ATCC 64428 TaxID=1128425 RepID=A0A0D7AIP3_9AGAR|nr:hypothetical protein FISHEDRAFT_57555 [Fistulina hepatica ATCC 64428]
MSQSYFSSEDLSVSPTQQTVSYYDAQHRPGVIAVVAVGFATSISVVSAVVIASLTFRRGNHRYTHVFGYSLSLLFANLLQGVATVMSLEWILRSQVTLGPYCNAQGGLKQAGNIGSAWWSFVISLHLFNLLFLRTTCHQIWMWFTLVVGWLVVAILVLLGPAAIEKPSKGSFYGVSGYCCWITLQYPKAQIYLEFLVEYAAIALALILYVFVLLRVRGNIVQVDGEWRFRLVPSEQKWKLVVARDLIDQAMLQVAQVTVWFPIIYTIIIIPISVTRLLQISGKDVPFWAVVTTDFIFNLNGLANVILMVVIRRIFPEVHGLPSLATPRPRVSLDTLSQSGGITPFLLRRSATAQAYKRPDPEFAARFRSIRRSKTTADAADSPARRTPRTGGMRVPRPLKLPRALDQTAELPVTPSRVRLPLSPATPLWRMHPVDTPSYRTPRDLATMIPPPETPTIRIQSPSPSPETAKRFEDAPEGKTL